MRLLKRNESGELSLTKPLNDNEVPPYAILSHTWRPNDEEEVTFDDFVQGTMGGVGYEKIRFCGEQAARDGLEYFWVDTCCINKSSSAELQEAIISMFRWYRRAARCYVYLSDVSARDHSIQENWEQAFRESRWFTRGWTLQELLAPYIVIFFSREGKVLGNKEDLEDLLHDITGIPTRGLQGSPMSHFTADERFLWAKARHTKRGEDEAYSLLGIFGISMTVMYGEGRANAFKRLRREIRDDPKEEEEEEEDQSSRRMQLNHGSAKSTLRPEKLVKPWTLARILRDHSAVATSIAFSPDSRRLVSGCEDGTIRSVDVRTGRVLQTLSSLDDMAVTRITFRPDNRVLASGYPDGTIRLWNPATGQELRALAIHDDAITSIAFSPDNRLLASASGDKTIQLSDATSYRALRMLEGHVDIVTCVAFSPDNKVLASASFDSTIRLWNPATGQRLRVLAGHSHIVTSIAFSPDNRLLASTSGDNTVRLWNVAKGFSPYRRLEVPGDAHDHVAFSPDSRQLASASYDGTMWLWNSATGDILQKLAATDDSIWSIVFSPNGSWLATHSLDGNVWLWYPATDRPAAS